ncbi:MAG: 4-hydroxy-tetrahydrodipicolinate synthase [Alistipes sp.]|nr:4-hydroxy-tetrahydrodipicolinate synthase [Alistipes sp.]
MKISDKFKGVGVALITPMQENGSVDFAALARVVERVLEGGVDYLLALGTTSESPTLTPDERVAVMRFIRERVAGRVPLMVGLGGNNTAELVKTLRSWDFEGYDAILSVNPYYNKPNQEGLYRHFMALAEASPLPIVLYNIPGRTGINMNPETVARLAASSEKFIGIKEASGNVEQMGRICRMLPKEFVLISGDDGLTVEAMRRGGVGVLSVLAHLYPAAVKALVAKAAEGDFDGADALLAPLQGVTDSLFDEGNPTGIKSALSVKGVCGNTVRLPLAEASDLLREKQQRLIDEYERE